MVVVGEPVATLSPEEDAEKVLQRYWNFGDTTTVPVDPIFIARQMGDSRAHTNLAIG